MAPYAVFYCTIGETEAQTERGIHFTNSAGMRARVGSRFKTYDVGETIHSLSLGFLVYRMGIIMPASEFVGSLNCDQGGTEVAQATGGTTETPFPNLEPASPGCLCLCPA